MKPRKFIPIFFILSLPALSACISSSDGGSSRPNDVNVIVPPSSTMIDPSNAKTDSRRIDSR